MHPEFSLILLTALAGAGQGLFTLLVAVDMRWALAGEPLSAQVMAVGAVVSIALAAAGALASFFHLSHKMRGWKAVRMWRRSWLSREALLLPVFMGLAFLYAVAAFTGAPEALRLTLGVLGAVAALALYLSTGMVYAAVTFVREWSTGYTPVNFTLIGLATGSVAAVAVFEAQGGAAQPALSALRSAFGITVIAFIAKLLAWRREGRLYSQSNIQTALGINHPDIRLSDMGTSYAHYNTKEYHYTKLADRRGALKNVAALGLFIIPLILMTADYMPLLRGGAGSLALPAAVIMLAGALLERWLFFAEGNHSQNLYYGAFKDKGAPNPLLQAGK